MKGLKNAGDNIAPAFYPLPAIPINIKTDR